MGGGRFFSAAIPRRLKRLKEDVFNASSVWIAENTKVNLVLPTLRDGTAEPGERAPSPPPPPPPKAPPKAPRGKIARGAANLPGPPMAGGFGRRAGGAPRLRAEDRTRGGPQGAGGDPDGHDLHKFVLSKPQGGGRAMPIMRSGAVGLSSAYRNLHRMAFETPADSLARGAREGAGEGGRPESPPGSTSDISCSGSTFELPRVIGAENVQEMLTVSPMKGVPKSGASGAIRPFGAASPEKAQAPHNFSSPGDSPRRMRCLLTLEQHLEADRHREVDLALSMLGKSMSRPSRDIFGTRNTGLFTYP